MQPVTSNLLQTPDNCLNRWQHLQKIRQLLWKRWHTEYLQELQQRNKWKDSDKWFKPGILVLMIEDNMPSLRWPIGRIMKTFPR